MLRKTLIGLAASLALAAGSSSAFAQVGTVFTYQGQLKNSGAVVNTATDMQFSLWNDPVLSAPANQVGSTITQLGVGVSQGLFTTGIDFGVNPYTAGDGQALWLQIAVRNPAGSGLYVTMGARQKLTAAPFSLATRGVNVGVNNRVGILANPYPTGEVSLTLGSAGGADPAASILFNNLAGGGDWEVDAFDNATDHGDFTISRKNLDFPFIIRGDTGDMLLNPQVGGKVGIGTLAPDAKVDIAGNTRLSGPTQLAGSPNVSLFVGGNDSGPITFPASATPSDKIGIRLYNDFSGPGSSKIEAWNFNSNSPRLLAINPAGGSVGVGTESPASNVKLHVRQASDNVGILRIDSGVSATQYAVVGFADRGSQIWSCGLRPDGMFGIDQDGINTRLQIDLLGNVGLNGQPPVPGRRLSVGGGAFCTGTAWVDVCDKNAKEGFAEICPEEVLKKVADLPVTTWRYKGQDKLHIGPTAQDFYAAFGFGESDTTITAVDTNGVSLAAIKGLKAENDQLKSRLEKIEALLAAQAANHAK